jgi:transposase
VTTTPAPTADFAVRPTLQANLAARRLPPRAQLGAAGSVTSAPLLTRRTAHGIALVGPAPADPSWQGQAKNGGAAANCVRDGDANQAICPPGQRRVVGMEGPDRHAHATVRSAVSPPGGAACASRAACPRAASAPRARRSRAHDHDPARQAARARQQTETCTQVDARRAGIEGPMAQGTRRGDLRRSRSLGWVHTRRMHRLIAAARTFMRVAAWRADLPRAQTQPSACAALAAAE